MTQTVTNNLNNLQDMLTQTQQKVQTVMSEASAMDKQLKSDFDKIYNKQLNNTNSKSSDKTCSSEDTSTNNIQSEISPNDNQTTKTSTMTIGEMKEDYRKPLTTEELQTLREAISEATGEANIESSLDLTLERDIDTIISQFKDSETTEEYDQTTETDEQQFDTTENTNLYQQIFASVKTENILYENQQAVEIPQNETIIEISDEVTDIASEITKAEETEQPLQKLEDIIDEEIIKDLKIETVEAETSTGSNEGSLMEHQTPQEQAVKAMLQSEGETFELKVNSTNNVQNTQGSSTKSTDITPSKIIEQITKQMEGLQNSSKVNIVLNPESLGKVTIQLIKTGEGLSAQFTVANQEVKDMLMKGLDGLKETLMSQGVGVDNVSVKLNETQKSEYNADWTDQEGSRGGNKNQENPEREEKEKGLFERMMAQANEENGKV